jgi:hypothetical protein
MICGSRAAENSGEEDFNLHYVEDIALLEDMVIKRQSTDCKEDTHETTYPFLGRYSQRHKDSESPSVLT